MICHECCLSLLVYLVVLMGNGTNTLLLILLITDEYELRMRSCQVTPDKWDSPRHDLLPLLLGGLPHHLPGCLASLQALVAPYVLTMLI